MKLEIEATKSTPAVRYDEGSRTLYFQGQSYPENSYKFYEPILEWVDEYLGGLTGESFFIEMNLPYINTSSTKCMMMILEKFEAAYTAGKKVSLVWYYDEENESELECAEEFKEDLSFPFDIQAKLQS